MRALWICTPIATLTIVFAGVTPAQEPLIGEALARKSGCLECHAVDERVIGPPYREVAARYKDDADARAALIEKVRKGGKGNWTKVARDAPMPPHAARLSEEVIEQLVDWVLGLERSEEPPS